MPQPERPEVTRVSTSFGIDSRVTIHPFMSLLSGTSRFLELGGHLSEDQRQHIVRYTAEVKSQHPSDTQVEAQVRRLDELFDRS